MHSKSDNIEIMMKDEVIKKNKLLRKKLNHSKIVIKKDLETKMKGREFVFDYVFLLYYKFHKINPKSGGSHIDSQDWIRKKPTINLINKKDNKCSQYTATVTLNHE